MNSSQYLFRLNLSCNWSNSFFFFSLFFLYSNLLKVLLHQEWVFILTEIDLQNMKLQLSLENDQAAHAKHAATVCIAIHYLFICLFVVFCLFVFFFWWGVTVLKLIAHMLHLISIRLEDFSLLSQVGYVTEQNKKKNPPFPFSAFYLYN